MPGLLGKKLGMSRIFGEDGNVIPVTAIEVGPCKVLEVRTTEKNGYNALQLGFGLKKKNISKPVQGQYKKLNTEPAKVVREFRQDEVSEFKTGDVFTAEYFKEGEKIKVRGVSKGKGFQGVMRRHGFGGVGGTTHGQSDRLRAPGSIGSSSYPSRVFKGQRMAGRMGNDNITIANLRVVKVLADKNIVLVKGAVPGAVNSIVELLKK
ncbi:MAG: 50S ribosomal protein L3 [Ignavibacteriales bacterium]|nr:50S ribosomal protein L3 [Ignavibacteriales bacterium]MBI5726594.1 50S ribosomal protein L3 [Ignavibacteriales bacterium]